AALPTSSQVLIRSAMDSAHPPHPIDPNAITRPPLRDRHTQSGAQRALQAYNESSFTPEVLACPLP
ncbi:MAG: hypothetical protein WCK83_16410, partial [Burkholderiales bacterium]